MQNRMPICDVETLQFPYTSKHLVCLLTYGKNAYELHLDSKGNCHQLVAQLVETEESALEIVGSNTSGVRDFSLLLCGPISFLGLSLSRLVGMQH